jgi:hypothetical protein
MTIVIVDVTMDIMFICNAEMVLQTLSAVVPHFTPAQHGFSNYISAKRELVAGNGGINDCTANHIHRDNWFANNYADSG